MAPPHVYMLKGPIVVIDPYIISSALQNELPSLDDPRELLKRIEELAGVVDVSAQWTGDTPEVRVAVDFRKGIKKVTSGARGISRFCVHAGNVLIFDIALLPDVVAILPTRDAGADNFILRAGGGFDWKLRVGDAFEQRTRHELGAAPIVALRGGVRGSAFVGDGDYEMLETAFRAEPGGGPAFRETMNRFQDTVAQLRNYGRLPW